MEVSFIRVFLLCRRAVPAAWHSRLSVSVLRSFASFLSLLLSRNGERAYHCRRGEREPWKRRICGLTIKDVSETEPEHPLALQRSLGGNPQNSNAAGQFRKWGLPIHPRRECRK